MCLYREYILRKYLNLNTADYNEIDADDVDKFLEWNEDEAIQAKIDLYGAGGTDITKPESGTTFYKDWVEKQKEKAEKHETEDSEYSEEDNQRLDEKFGYEIQKMVGRRHFGKNVMDKK